MKTNRIRLSLALNLTLAFAIPACGESSTRALEIASSRPELAALETCGEGEHCGCPPGQPGTVLVERQCVETCDHPEGYPPGDPDAVSPGCIYSCPVGQLSKTVWKRCSDSCECAPTITNPHGGNACTLTSKECKKKCDGFCLWQSLEGAGTSTQPCACF